MVGTVPEEKPDPPGFADLFGGTHPRVKELETRLCEAERRLRDSDEKHAAIAREMERDYRNSNEKHGAVIRALEADAAERTAELAEEVARLEQDNALFRLTLEHVQEILGTPGGGYAQPGDLEAVRRMIAKRLAPTVTTPAPSPPAAAAPAA